MAAGAHAEGIDSGIIQMLHQLVVRRRQHRANHSVLAFIHGSLLMFDTDTHSKGLGLHGNSGFLQHFEGVPGAVADGQNTGIAGNDLARFRLQAGKSAVFRA